MGLLSLLGFGNNKIKEALKAGAVIIDVRTAHEYDQGRIPQSVNIPVDRISANIERIKAMKKPIVLCCASGMRSGMAAGTLRSKGLRDVYNGGSWQRVLRMLNSIGKM
jgi:phage shock protein E